MCADRGTVSGNEMHGRNIGEREGRGRRRRGSRWGGCTRKTGVKSPQKFSTKPLIVLASGKRGGKPRIYNAPMANSFPLSRHAYASVAYTCRKNSIAGENRSSRFRRRGGEISSHFPFFHFSPHFVSFARFHFDRAEYIYIYIKRKRVRRPCPIVALTNSARVAIYPDFGCISLDVDRLPE